MTVCVALCLARGRQTVRLNSFVVGSAKHCCSDQWDLRRSVPVTSCSLFRPLPFDMHNSSFVLTLKMGCVPTQLETRTCA